MIEKFKSYSSKYEAIIRLQEQYRDLVSKGSIILNSESSDSKYFEDTWIKEYIRITRRLYKEYEALQLSRVDFNKFTSMCMLDLHVKSKAPLPNDPSVPHFSKYQQQRLLSNVDVSEEVFDKANELFPNIISESFDVNKELRSIEAELLYKIRSQMPLKSLSDIGDLSNLNTLITTYYEKREELWVQWQRYCIKRQELFSPTQRGLGLLGRTKFFEHAITINDMWAKINGQVCSPTQNSPFVAATPFPVHVSPPSLHGIYSGIYTRTTDT